MKDWHIFTLLIGVVAVVFVGFAWLLVWDTTNSARERREECTKVAQLAGAESHREKDRECSLVVDGKLKIIEL